MKNHRYPLLFLLMFGMIILSTVGVCADEIEDLNSEKSTIQKKLDETQKEKKAVTDEKKATLSDVDSLEVKLQEIAAEIDDLNQQLAKAQADLERQELEYARIVEKLGLSQEQMQARITSIYVNGDISYWDVLFNANSIGDFLSSFAFFERIVEQDQTIIGDIKENKRLAQEKLDELTATKATIEEVTVSKEAQEDTYNVQMEEKQALVQQLSAQEDTLAEIEAEFEAESSRITQEIQALYAQQEAARQAAANDSGSSNGDGSNGGGSGSYTSPEYTGNGTFTHPLKGKGTRTQGYHSGHTAIDFGAPIGTAIVAAESGNVILVRYLTYSYGYYVVIDHGGGYSTLYAHMSRIDVSVGQSVSRGQQIGAVGSTGRSTGPHLHFEVRVNGVAKNPLNYL